VRRPFLPGVLLALGGALGCLFPADHSAQLRVELDSVPELFLRDSVRFTARVLTAAGDSVPGAVVSFTSSQPTVLSVGAAGEGLAVGVGQATVTASALAFAGATPATADVRVRGLLEIDSVKPPQVRFGDSLHVFGVGLNPDSLFTMSLGGVELSAAQYLAADPKKPGRVGRLSLWVRPPAERFSTLTLVSFAGGVVFPDTIGVLQRDRYEPNDTTPSNLGGIPSGFYNPGLAFEAGGRADVAQPADWFTFTNATVTDRTIIVSSEFVGAATFSVFITDSLGWRSGQYVVGSRSWTIGPQTYLCSGKSVTRNGQPVVLKEQVFPITIVSLAGLPAGTYHVLVPYLAPAQPRAYQVLISSSYQSSLPRDATEENDYCDVAKPITATATTPLSIDNPHDIDWYRFSVTTAGVVQFTATGGKALNPNLPDPDLDLYLIRSFPDSRVSPPLDSLVLVAAAQTDGSTETLSAPVLPGNYFLVVVDFAGSPATYTLASTIPPAPPLAPPQPEDAATARRREASQAASPVGASLRAQGAGRP